MDERQLLGKKCEALAASFLKKQGYQIISQNWRCRLGEIDIIAAFKDQLVFVEVKSGQNQDINPLESINLAKQRKLKELAQYYLSYVYKKQAAVRFDAVCVVLTQGPAQITHIQNAF